MAAAAHRIIAVRNNEIIICLYQKSGQLTIPIPGVFSYNLITFKGGRRVVVVSGKEFFNLLRLSVFSPRCQSCGLRLVTPDELLFCRECMAGIRPFAVPLCDVCGRPTADCSGPDPFRCGECLIDPPPFKKHASYCAYAGLIRDAIIVYKYRQSAYLTGWLAGMLTEAYYERLHETVEWVVPVPADRRRRRGFNPVTGLAARLAKSIGTPMARTLVKKVKHRPPQVTLTERERRRNLRGAFALMKPVEKVAGKKVLLVDDVYTTGTTIRSCAGILTEAGCEVTALTLARSV
jgi:ComF family protein